MQRRGTQRMTAGAAALSARFRRHLLDLAGPELGGQALLVALSGGLDSVVLLHLLRSLPREARPSLVAAHFDHRMRPGSGADADWVAGLCRAWRIPLERAAAPSAPVSEAEARALRYAFLRAAAARAGASLIVTAHHADDQAETVLFRALRGAGLVGLSGIAPHRGDLVRPLLPFTRTELEAHAHAAGLRWRDDPSNLDLRYARNRLRLRVLPALEAVIPGAAGALARSADAARGAEAAWSALLEHVETDVVAARAEGVTEVARTRFLAYHPRVRARCLRRLLRRHGCAPDRAGTRAALEFIRSGGSGGAVALSGGLRIGREFDRIQIRGVGPGVAAPDRPVLIARAGGGEANARIGGRPLVVRWSLSSRGGHRPGSRAFAVDALCFPVELRGWRPGDRIRLPYGTKKLKKLFLERRIGRADRRRIPVLAHADGEVLWVVGVSHAPEAPTASGGGFLRITVKDARHG